MENQENILFIREFEDGSKRPVEVPQADVDLARQDPRMTEAAKFNRGDQTVVIKKDQFGEAIKAGLKPVQDVSFLSAIGTGFKSGVETTASGSGFGAKPLEDIGKSAEEEMAFAQRPIEYSLGKLGGIILPAAGVGAAGIIGTRQSYRAAKPLAAAATKATKSQLERAGAAREGFSAGYAEKVAEETPLKPLAKGIQGLQEAKRSYQAAGRTQEAVGEFGAGGGGPGGVDFLNFIDPGSTPDKKYIAGRAATIAPSRYKTEDLDRFFSMGTEERQRARQFNQLKEAEKFVPDLQRLFDGLEEGEGATHRALQERASKQFWPAFANDARKAIDAEESRINRLPDPPQIVRKAISEARAIINEGLAADPRAPVTQNVPWSKASNAEKYFRMDYARRVFDAYLNPKIDNPELQRSGVVSSLQSLRESVDASLKRIPDKALADQIYATAKDASDLFYKGMELPKGEKIDAPKLAKLFDPDKDNGYRWSKAIDKMEYLLETYGDQLAPDDKNDFLGIVQRSRELQKMAEEKRFVAGQLWSSGPTGPAVEREASLLQREQRGLRPLTKRGAPKDILESPALAISNLDEFVGQASAEFYGGKKPSELSMKQKRAISEMFTFRQMNPNIDIENEKSAFKAINKKWSE